MVVATDPSVLRDVPEFFESEIEESLAARTESLATFRELGPPDLCHIIKSNPKGTPLKELGSYHYVLGADASSSATIAAYLNSLTYMLAQPQGKPSPWKVKGGTFCCFDAFSRVDVRVQVKIPGGVESYIVDLRGDRHAITNQEIWQETFVSSVLRAISDDNDAPDGNEGMPLLGLRKIDPLPTPNAERRFLEAVSFEFWKGWQLGTDCESQTATTFSNHLTTNIFKYFEQAGRLAEAARFFSSLDSKDQGVAAILAKAYIGTDEEIQAVQVMHEASKRQPVSYHLLLVQTEFLMGKKQHEKALNLAKLAVAYAPSEFIVWAKLAEIYIELDDHESALLALNSCPMFTYVERDNHRMPPPARTHLPLRQDATTLKPDQDPKTAPQTSGTLFDENDPRENQVHPELQRLPSLSLRGTFLRAYQILVRIVSKAGWDNLLKFRSQVFVMEDEYRIHRSIVEEAQASGVDPDDAYAYGNDDNGDGEDDDDNDNEDGSDGDNGEKNGHSSREPSTRKRDNPATDSVGFGDNNGGRFDFGSNHRSHSPASAAIAPSSASSLTSSPSRTKNTIDDLLKRTSGDQVGSSNSQQTQQQGKKGKVSIKKKKRAPNPRINSHRISFSFKHKRMCEKWLDNLFMVLYTDLRLYASFNQEVNQLKIQNSGTTNPLMFRKTGAEWEIYGDLAERLQHRDEAKEAYRLCLDQKLSTKSYLKLMQLYAEDGNIQLSLQSAVKMATLLDRTVSEHTYPSTIARALFLLIRKHGLAKVQNVLISMNVPASSFRHVSRYFEYAELFRVAGSEW